MTETDKKGYTVRQIEGQGQKQTDRGSQRESERGRTETGT